MQQTEVIFVTKYYTLKFKEFPRPFKNDVSASVSASLFKKLSIRLNPLSSLIGVSQKIQINFERAESPSNY